MKVLSMGFLPNTKSHVHMMGKMHKKARCVVAQLAIRFKRKMKGTKKFGVRLGKLSGWNDFRKVFSVRLVIVPFS